MFNPSSWNQSIDLKLIAEDTEALVSLAEYPAGYLPINGTKTVKYLGLLPIEDNVTITCAANELTTIFAITGLTDIAGQKEPQLFTEYLPGANTAVATSVTIFQNVISIIPNRNTTGAVTVGDAGVSDGICLSQSGTANTALVINGVYLSGQYNIYYPQYLVLTCTGDETSNTFTIFGSDQSTSQYTFQVPGINSGTTIIPIPYKLIGNDNNGNFQGFIQMENPSDDTISVGITEQTATPWIQCDQARPYFQVGINVILSDGAVLTYTVEETIQSAIKNVITSPFPDGTLVNSTNPLGTTLLNGPTAFFRLTIPTWTSGSATLLSAQTGSAFSGYITDRRPK